MIDNELQQLITDLKLQKSISLEEIPSLDLYMDQVIQLFENKFSGTLRNENDKVLTKTMINNYSKDKLFMQVKNKKYSKQHLVLLSLIYQLKGSLSINDIKNALNPIVKDFEAGKQYPLEEFYSTYLNLYEQNVDIFKRDIIERLDDVKKISDNNQSLKDDFENNFLLMLSLVTMSNFYRKAAEKILDNFIPQP